VQDLEVHDRDGLLEARFVQSYESDRFSDVVQKSLFFIREDRAWRIADEVSR